MAFDDMGGKIWYNGQLVDWSQPRVHILSHGLHYGSCVFEGERAYGGKIFKHEEHIERLFFSAKELDIEIPFSQQQIEDACYEALEAEGHLDAYVRPVVWRGSGMMAVSAQNSGVHCAGATWRWGAYFPREELLKGINLDWAKYRRPNPDSAPVHAKAAGLYMICTLSKHEAERNGYADALMLDYRGYVAESTGSNIFFIKDGEIHTPLADCFLNGITRRTVIDLAGARGYPVIERHILPDELLQMQECFLVGTAVEVTPVGQIGEHRFQTGQITTTLMDDYTALVNPPA